MQHEELAGLVCQMRGRTGARIYSRPLDPLALVSIEKAEITGGEFMEIYEGDKLALFIQQLKAAAVRDVSDPIWNAPLFFTLKNPRLSSGWLI